MESGLARDRQPSELVKRTCQQFLRSVQRAILNEERYAASSWFAELSALSSESKIRSSPDLVGWKWACASVCCAVGTLKQ